MNLTEYQLKVLNAEICPYCMSETKVVTETEIYGKEYRGRKVHCCVNFPICDAFVGSHDDGSPLGRLANKELRNAKIFAHFYFDKLWREHKQDRGDVYKRLSEHLNIPAEYTHIGMFKIDTCNKVIEWAKEQLNQISK